MAGDAGVLAKKALITGASGGVGSAVSRRLAADGFEVWLHCFSGEERAAALAGEIAAAGGRARVVRFDIRSEADIERELAPLLSREGPLHALVNNAGVTRDGYMMMLPEEHWLEILDVNLSGFFRVTRACLKGMVQARSGRIVNIGSLAGDRGNVGQVAYAASKAGLVGATRALALEMARWNILVNTVSSGPLDVGMAAGLAAEKLVPQIPLGRLGRAEDVAGAVSFLVSPDASYITGQVIRVNGGMGM